MFWEAGVGVRMKPLLAVPDSAIYGATAHGSSLICDDNVPLPTLGRANKVVVVVVVVVVMILYRRSHWYIVLDQMALIYDTRRPFLLPRVKALRLIESILLSLVGDVGLGAESLPDRPVRELSDDSDVDLLRPSSARMSSRETLR